MSEVDSESKIIQAMADSGGNVCPDGTFPACFEAEDGGCQCFEHIERVRAVGGGTGYIFDPESAWERRAAYGDRQDG